MFMLPCAYMLYLYNWCILICVLLTVIALCINCMDYTGQVLVLCAAFLCLSNRLTHSVILSLQCQLLK